MEKNHNATPKFETGIWVTGKLKSNYDFIGRTCKLSDGRNEYNAFALVTELGELMLLKSELVDSFKHLSLTTLLTTNLGAKLKFSKKIRVTGDHDAGNFIGITCLRKGREVVALVAQSCKTEYMPFDQIRNLKELSINNKKPPHSIPHSNCNKIGISIHNYLKADIILSSIYNKN